MCRQVSAILSLAVLIFYIYIYRNLSVINNQLLLKLKKQNSDLKHQIKELSKEISIIRHCVMNQPVTDSDDSDEEPSRKGPLQLKKPKKTKHFRVLSAKNDDPSKTSTEINNQDLGSGDYDEDSEDDFREERPATSGTKTSLSTSGANESTAGIEEPEPILITEVAVTAPVTGQPIATSVTERPEITSVTESTSGIERPPSGETPQSRYSLRSSNRHGSPT
ncbi:uncharacterized protein LOC117330930 [Pecten maximus]|uniref:uncharacterized protein LOC117330930 n=1 Tax=Pecten maximus TaxID=6579 RepID=UPI0014585F67|nr:uncharacterized protein LOC117330930 [Pecten maximus]